MAEIHQLVIESTNGIRVYPLSGDTQKQKCKNLKRFVRDLNDHTKIVNLSLYCDLWRSVFVNAEHIVSFRAVDNCEVDERDNKLVALKEMDRSICCLVEKVAEIAVEIKKQNEPIIREVKPRAKKPVKGV